MDASQCDSLHPVAYLCLHQGAVTGGPFLTGKQEIFNVRYLFFGVSLKPEPKSFAGTDQHRIQGGLHFSNGNLFNVVVRRC
jgi:hypothetical protein